MQWIIVRQTGSYIVDTPWSSDVEKQFQIDWLGETFSLDQSIESYTFVAAVWMPEQIDEQTGAFGRRFDARKIHTQQRDGETPRRSYEVLQATGVAKLAYFTVTKNTTTLMDRWRLYSSHPSKHEAFGPN